MCPCGASLSGDAHGAGLCGSRSCPVEREGASRGNILLPAIRPHRGPNILAPFPPAVGHVGLAADSAGASSESGRIPLRHAARSALGHRKGLAI